MYEEEQRKWTRETERMMNERVRESCDEYYIYRVEKKKYTFREAFYYLFSYVVHA